MPVCFMSFVIPLDRLQNEGFKLRIQIDHADFTDWRSSFLLFNLTQEISPDSEALSSNT